MSTTTTEPPAGTPGDASHDTLPGARLTGLSTGRLNVVRGGYLFMGGGLVIVKWPLLQDAHTLPLYEGVTLCLLTAMSVLALLGLRFPVKLLPVLVFEVLWKLLWLVLVALPVALAGDLDPAMSEVAVNCGFVVVVVAVLPWRYLWRQYVRAAGDPWRAGRAT